MLITFGKKNNDLADIADRAKRTDRTDQHLNITIAAVSLHITREAVLRSGLFGLLGDAPVQIVGFDDDDRLGQFHEIFNQNAMAEEPEVQIFFDTFQIFQSRTAVEMWTRQAEWMIFARMWQRAQQPINTKESETSIYIEQMGTKPSLAWLPELPEKVSIDMDQHSPNMDHHG